MLTLLRYEDDRFHVEKFCALHIDVILIEGREVNIALSEVFVVQVVVLPHLEESESFSLFLIELLEKSMEPPVLIVVELDNLLLLFLELLNIEGTLPDFLFKVVPLQLDLCFLDFPKDLILNVLIILDSLESYLHVWPGYFVESLDIDGNLVWIFPVIVLEVEAQVNNDSSWSSGETRSAMDIDFLFLNVNELVELHGDLEESILERLRIRVFDWHVDDSVDLLRSVEHLDLLAVDASCGLFGCYLKIDDGIDSSSSDFININLVKWVWADNEILPLDLRDEESTKEVTICHIESTIHKVVYVIECLLIITFLSILAIIQFGVLDINNSLWLSLDELVCLLDTCQLIVIINLLEALMHFVELAVQTGDGVWVFDKALPWSHFLSVLGVQPFIFLIYFFHLDNCAFSPVCSHNHPFSLFIDWPEDGESNEQCFPLVGEGEVLHAFLL